MTLPETEKLEAKAKTSWEIQQEVSPNLGSEFYMGAKWVPLEDANLALTQKHCELASLKKEVNEILNGYMNYYDLQEFIKTMRKALK